MTRRRDDLTPGMVLFLFLILWYFAQSEPKCESYRIFPKGSPFYDVVCTGEEVK